MKQAVIKTPFPSSTETAKRLGISESRTRELLDFVDGLATQRTQSRRRARRTGAGKRKVK